ncbi:MAG: AI-2E family transporter, partial [Chloroflexota bacterium]|nr:AI-2E family transporter [Chloroflexota bacterium]
MRRVATIVAVVLGILTLFAIAWQLRSIVLLFMMSVIIAAIARRPIDRLMNRKVSRSVAILIVYLLGIGGLVAIIYGVSGPLAGELSAISQDIVTEYSKLQSTWQSGSRIGPVVSNRLPSPEQFATFIGSDETAALTQVLLGATQGFFNGLTQFLLALVVSIYWTVDQLRFERLWLSLLPAGGRAR